MRPGRPDLIAAAVTVVLVAALAWRFDLIGVRSSTPLASVASAFDSPPPYPGYHWTRDGRPATEFEITTIAGPDHCGWGAATMLFIGWPPGTVARTGEQTRQFIRDPQGAIAGDFRQQLRRGVRLPTDARTTGYRYGPLEVFVSPSDDGGIYVVSPVDAERWPISYPRTACA